MTPDRIGVGVVGVGFGARVHVPAFRLLESLGVDVRAICASAPGRAEAAAQALGLRAFHGWEELVGDPAVDLVAVAVPPAANPEIALATRSAGKALLCEKPIAADVATARSLAHSAGTAPALVDFVFRALPAFRVAENLVAEGGVGTVDRLRVVWDEPTPPTGASVGWKDDPALGGGVLSMYGIHAFDYMAHLAGPVESATAVVRREVGFSARFALTGGAEAEVAVERGTRARGHRVEVEGRRHLVLENADPVDGFRHWTVRLDGREVAVPALSSPARSGSDPRVEPVAVHAAELVTAVRDGRPATPSLADGMRAQLVLEAARLSAEEGRTIRVEEVESRA